MCSVVRLTGSYRPCLSRFLISSSRHIPFPRRLLTPFIGSLPSPLHLVRYASRTEWNGVWRDVEWKEGEEVGYGWKQSEMWSGVTDVDRLPSLCIPLLTTSLPSVRLSALHSPLIAGGAAPRAERSEEERSGGGMARTPRIHPAYRSYFLGSVVLSSHSPPVTPFRAHFVHSPLRAVGEWNETEDVETEGTTHGGMEHDEMSEWRAWERQRRG